MTTPTIQFLDSIGAVTITATGLSLNNWLPDVDEVNDRAVPMGTGLEEFWRYRRDFTASFEMPHIKAANLAKLLRLKSHLLTGGFARIATNDSKSRVYTVSVKPGATPEWSFADRQQLEYTLTLDVRNVAPYPMLCDYTSYTGNTEDEITNGGGESGTVGSQATGWTKTAGNGLLVASDEALLGSRSLKTTHTVTTSSNSNQSSISVTAGERWLLSGWVKTEALQSGTSNGASIDLTQAASAVWTVVKKRGDSRSSSITSPGIAADGSAHDWSYVYALVDITTGGTVAVNCALKTTGAGSAWWDDVRFEPVEAV